MAYSLTYSYDSASQSYSVTGYSGITARDKVVIPDTYNNGTNGEHPVTSIGDRAFIECYSLTNVTIGNSVTSIGANAFNSCDSLTSIIIPGSVTSIGNGAFYNCSSLTSISVDENNQSYKSIDGNLYTKDGATLIQYAIGKTATSFVIPDSVTSIGNGAFYNCSSLTSVTIPNSVTYIGDYAFLGCSGLTSITIPDSVTSIGNSAFRGCSGLTSVIIPNNITSIGNSAFSYCSGLTSVTIPNSVTSIGNSAFSYCSSLIQLILFPLTPPTLVSGAIPATVQSIYVKQSSKAAYQAATNWTAFASKIVGDNLYLSFIRFNQKNKEYIDGKISEFEISVPTRSQVDLLF